MCYSIWPSGSLLVSQEHKSSAAALVAPTIFAAAVESVCHHAGKGKGATGELFSPASLALPYPTIAVSVTTFSNTKFI